VTPFVRPVMLVLVVPPATVFVTVPDEEVAVTM
jgi:hypothetical protein